ncbi:MAG: VWA domain-containing protein [Candidatus Bathyarchaeota archaeon]|nr:VWA domain-containing protein [Candidatus Bathyarchaeota archaeon]
MGFIEYAWGISLQKDDTKVKILQDPNLTQPTLQTDNVGFTIKLPTAKVFDGGDAAFLGHRFGAKNKPKAHVGRLFRASVVHLTAHTLEPFPKEKVVPTPSDPITEAYAKSLINDTYVNAYVQTKHPECLPDIAYTNTLAYQKIKASNRIFNPSTRLMAAILTKTNTGFVKNSLGTDEEKALDEIAADLAALKDTFKISITEEQTVDLNALFDQTLKKIKDALEPFGPFLEAPSLRHTESLGNCSIYSEVEASSDFDSIFPQALTSLGGTMPQVDSIEEVWRPEQEAEALQAFNSDYYQKLKEEKILTKIQPYLALTKFKDVVIPEEDYTQYLRARSLVQGANRRLLEILRSVYNYLDEDPRQEMGQLDLAAVIQSIAAQKPATDVFVLDEYLQPSFAWSLLFDVSNSMQVKGEQGRALAIAVAEAAKELMMDATSWSFFGFSDKLYILKDSTESYSKKVRARIGGLKFEGLTFIPDAIQIAGKMLAKRCEEQRVLIVISDGWPYGYPEMPEVLKNCVEDLLRKNVIVLGIGVETDRMGKFFRMHSAVYTQKDLYNKFGTLYANASNKALET